MPHSRDEHARPGSERTRGGREVARKCQALRLPTGARTARSSRADADVMGFMLDAYDAGHAVVRLPTSYGDGGAPGEYRPEPP